jgi:hypothetical protein
LAAVLPHAGRIALDVSRIQWGSVERRGEQHDDLRSAPNQVGADGVHGAFRVANGNRAREHRPGLNGRVDPALVVLGRAERLAVVIVAAPVPSPSQVCSSIAQPAGLVAVALRRGPGPRASQSGANSLRTTWRKKPTQELSPRPSRPTRFMPSFQSPLPMMGRP